MKITAIVDCYNSEKFLTEAVQSVLDQKRLPDELIIVDDGSTDKTANLARELVEGIEWARVVEKENGGQLSCVSRGIVESSGDLLAFLDGDDYWLDHHLESAEKQFKENSKLTMYYSACTACGESEEYLYRSYAAGLIGQTQVVTASGGSYVGGLNSALVVLAKAVKPYLPLPHEIERDWVVNADNITIWLSSLYGGQKYAEVEPGIRYRLHAENAFKQQSLKPARIHRKVATEKFFEYCRSVFYIPDDIVKLLPQEYRAHPNKTKALKKEYLRAIKKSSHKLSFFKCLTLRIRIHFFSN